MPVLMLTARDRRQRPDPRPRRRRRRLPRQAVRLRRAPGPAPGPAPPRPVERPPMMAIGDLRIDPATRSSRAPARRSSSPRGSTTSSSSSPPRAGEVGLPRGAARGRLGRDYEGSPNIVDVYVGYLRKKLGAPGPDSSGRSAARDSCWSPVRLPIRVRLTAWYVAVLAAIIVGLGAFVVAPAPRRPAARGRPRACAPTALPDRASGTRTRAARTSPGQRHGAAPTAAGARCSTPADALLATGDAIESSLSRRPRSAPTRSPATRGSSPSSSASDESASASSTADRPPRPAAGARRRGAVPQVETRCSGCCAAPARRARRARRGGRSAGWWLARKALRPVDRMTSKAEQIGIDRLDERIAVPPRPTSSRISP